MVAAEALDDILTLASSAHFAASAAGALAEGGQSALAAEHAGKATAALVKLCTRLEALGAKDQAPLVKPPQENPLAELMKLERSRGEALALLEALRAALPLAEALDAKRGDVLTEPVAGYRGTEWGERVLQAVCGLELELVGPGVEHHGGRE